MVSRAFIVLLAYDPARQHRDQQHDQPRPSVARYELTHAVLLRPRDTPANCNGRAAPPSRPALSLRTSRPLATIKADGPPKSSN